MINKQTLLIFVEQHFSFGTRFANLLCNMKFPINIFPSNKLALLSVAVCAAMLAFSHNASASRIAAGINTPGTNLAFNDTHVVGTITPATPANPASVASYINFMIGLAPGTSGTFHNPPHTQSITRSTNLFASLPDALVPGAVSGTGTT